MDCFQERHQTTVSVLPTFTATYEQPAAPGFDCLSEVYGNAAFSPNAGAGHYGSEMGFLDVIQPKVPLVEGGFGVCKVEPGLVEGGGASPHSIGFGLSAPLAPRASNPEASRYFQEEQGEASAAAAMASTKVQRIMTQPINLIFRFLQSKARIQIWLFEQKDLRIEGRIIMSFSTDILLGIAKFSAIPLLAYTVV